MLQLETADAARREVSPRLAQNRKAALGQFMTPAAVAKFMASLFPAAARKSCRLLDPGAGIGALSCAFIDRWASGELDFTHMEVDAYEIDDALRQHLKTILGNYAPALSLAAHVLGGDFIWEAARKNLQGLRLYSHVILNPPYKKIHSASAHRLILRRQGIETVNLYTAFVALSLTLLERGGHLVAIIPRSFCNGPYYRPFRDFILSRSAIRRLHLFESRSKAFQDDDVLQENIIIHLEREGKQGPVSISTSTDHAFADFRLCEHPFERIVFPNDREHFIHIPTSPKRNAIEESKAIRFSLEDIGIEVSTGPVVDFRMSDAIVRNPRKGAVPLLYPAHFVEGSIRWPHEGAKRRNAIYVTSATKRWLYPNGFYTVTRRFSSKEERRRIMASVVRPEFFPDAPLLGFENHLNVFHRGKRGLPRDLAHGLAAYLNTTAVDDQFRRFNGHTQVNATDLRRMKYPSESAVAALGAWARHQEQLTQADLDDRLAKLTE